ncbi:MAG: YfiR family protein [Thermogutta sp.]
MAHATKAGEWTGGPAAARAAGAGSRRSCLRHIRLSAWLFVALLLPCLDRRDCLAQDGVVNRENLIKAAYLANFLRYVEWPNSAQDLHRPPIIGVAGQHPVLIYLQQAAKQGEGPSFQVETVLGDTLPEGCCILFLPNSLDPELRRKLLRSAKNFPVLTVGENVEFLQEGGEVRFVVEANKLRLELALRAIEVKQLKISSKLLQIARIVDAEPHLSQGSR